MIPYPCLDDSDTDSGTRKTPISIPIPILTSPGRFRYQFRFHTLPHDFQFYPHPMQWKLDIGFWLWNNSFNSSYFDRWRNQGLVVPIWFTSKFTNSARAKAFPMPLFGTNMDCLVLDTTLDSETILKPIVSIPILTPIMESAQKRYWYRFQTIWNRRFRTDSGSIAGPCHGQVRTKSKKKN